jgi:hypothetical protein
MTSRVEARQAVRLTVDVEVRAHRGACRMREGSEKERN